MLKFLWSFLKNRYSGICFAWVNTSSLRILPTLLYSPPNLTWLEQGLCIICLHVLNSLEAISAHSGCLIPIAHYFKRAYCACACDSEKRISVSQPLLCCLIWNVSWSHLLSCKSLYLSLEVLEPRVEGVALDTCLKVCVPCELAPDYSALVVHQLLRTFSVPCVQPQTLELRGLLQAYLCPLPSAAPQSSFPNHILAQN